MSRALRRRYGHASKKLTRVVLIDRLARDLVRGSPSYRGHEDSARHFVAHYGPGRPKSLKDLAYRAREARLITADEYVTIAGEGSYAP